VRKQLISLAVFTAINTANANEVKEEVIVTAPAMKAPLQLEIDAKAPQQPLPANDGAAFLKTVAGFNVIRKGGTSGDPVLRGQVASRLNIVLDGMSFDGGCGSRMDPPTAYVFPESYDSVTVIKGPQTVAHGAGHSAGVVLFENESKQDTGFSGTTSLMTGSWGRTDALADLRAANAKGFIEATLSHAEADDYKDGTGVKVHSAYERRSVAFTVGYTPTPITELSLDYTTSEADAAYADRGMDGSVFDRESFGITAKHKMISELLQNAEFRVYHTYIDHVMDNYSLRAKPPMMMFMSSNPDRTTDGAKFSIDFALAENQTVTAGFTWQQDEHTNRSGMGPTEAAADAFSSKPRIIDLKTEIVGIFGELEHQFDEGTRWISGLRVDDWKAQRRDLANPVNANETLTAAFTRFEHDLRGGSVTTYFGLGYTQRPLDYWEAISSAALDLDTQLKPETTQQLDMGFVWRQDRWSGSVSGFFGQMDDYILVYSGMMPSPRLESCTTRMMSTVCSGNIDATRYGLEADFQGELSENWSLKGNIAWVRGSNDTHNTALAQTPPLDATLNLEYHQSNWSAGVVTRYIAKQDRIDARYGTIVGQDISTTGDAFVVSLNATTALTPSLQLAAGLDNALDEDYAEHLSRAGATVIGYPAIDKVSEPGRTLWAKLSYSF